MPKNKDIYSTKLVLRGLFTIASCNCLICCFLQPAPVKVEPLYNPAGLDALVMPRPSQRHQVIAYLKDTFVIKNHKMQS